MTATALPPALPSRLFVRLSDHSLCMARYDVETPTAFAFSDYRLNPKISLAANLREAGRTEELLKAPCRDDVQVVVSGAATFVPLAEFQEEDCEALYDLSFPPDGKRRVFYDVVAAANCVVLFSLKEQTCHTLEEALGNVNYVSAFTPLIRHFAAKGTGPVGRKRCFVYAHEQTADLVVFEDNRLLVANSYAVSNAVDVSYFVLNMAEQLGAYLAPAGNAATDAGEDDRTLNADTFTPLYVAGDSYWLQASCRELQKYAVNVCPINPNAEFNRHVIATTPGVPYDLMTLLLDFK